MVLTGTYPRSLDDKLRFAFPRGLRQQLTDDASSGLFLAPGMDGSLVLYPRQAFEQLARRVAAASPTGKAVRAFSRLFYGQAQACEFDRQGRLRLPTELATWAGLSKEIVLVGVRDSIEIWDAARWARFRESLADSFDRIAEQALTAGHDDFGFAAPIERSIEVGTDPPASVDRRDDSESALDSPRHPR